MQDAATDDAIHVYESSDIQRFVNGTWSANYTVDDKYAHYYNGIHDANFFLENLTNLKFEDWQYGDDYENWMKEYANFEYEVRFLVDLMKSAKTAFRKDKDIRNQFQK